MPISAKTKIKVFYKRRVDTYENFSWIFKRYVILFRG